MSSYLFNEAGCIPGIPGNFFNCLVEVNDVDGTVHVYPLAQHPSFVAADPTEPSVDVPPVINPSIVQEPESVQAAPAPASVYSQGG